MAVAFFDQREARLRMLKIMNDVEHNLTSYLSVVTIINIAVGICGGVAAWVAGLPDPVAWAVLAFILNFIPYIGALIMEAATVHGRSRDFSNTYTRAAGTIAVPGACDTWRGISLHPASWAANSRSTRLLYSYRWYSGRGCGDRSALFWRCRY